MMLRCECCGANNNLGIITKRNHNEKIKALTRNFCLNCKAPISLEDFYKLHKFLTTNHWKKKKQITLTAQLGEK